MFKVTTKNETIGIKEISYRNMKKLLCKDFLRFIQSNKTETNIDTSKINNDIKHIITEYKKVFPDDLPLKLSPDRPNKSLTSRQTTIEVAVPPII